MEEKIIHHWIHNHPLSQIPNFGAETSDNWFNWCGGCWRYLLPGEAAYGCMRKCGSSLVFHRECLELPREIRHHVHPSHILTQEDNFYDTTGKSACAVCEENSGFGMVYICRKEGCDQVWIHMGCAVDLESVAIVDREATKLNHPSHPHLLRFSKNPTPCCDACGTDGKGNSYVCTICDYSMHESCARLPASKLFPHHPDHSLSLAFRPPYEYIRYEFDCAICKGALRLRCWVYHCHLCRYVVHIKCATDSSLATPSNSYDNQDRMDDQKGIIKSPFDDIFEEIIRPFVKREKGEIFVPHNENNIINGKYSFNNHQHPLKFIAFSPSSSSRDHSEEEEKYVVAAYDDDDDDDNDDDDDYGGGGDELICDGCTLSIHGKKDDNGYMRCDECKYSLHLACFNLPPELASHPLHPINDHKLTLRNSGKLTNWAYCEICNSYTNGLYYACTECHFTLDIKCASLPNTVKHEAHPQHHCLSLVRDNRGPSFCGICFANTYYGGDKGFYKCDSCKLCMCGGCVLLPARNKHGSDKHWLPFTHDAYVHHRGYIYCGSCEGRMNPKTGMYHCRDCDQCFHPKCFPATSGEYRNIMYGNYVVTTTIHSHPIRFQIITKKKRCDLCHQDSYGKPGFQCKSCNFVMCLHPCSAQHIKDFYKDT